MRKWWKKRKAVRKLETQSDHDPFYPWTDSERATPEADDQELRDAISMFLYDKPERRRLQRKRPDDDWGTP